MKLIPDFIRSRLPSSGSRELQVIEPKHVTSQSGWSLKSVPLRELMPGVSSRPKWRDWSTSHAFREGYNASVWVYLCVEKRRRAIVQLPWHVEVMTADGWQRRPEHPLQRLLDEPNPEMTTQEMLGRTVQWLDLGGNAYWFKVRGGQQQLPLEIWPTMPDAMRVLAGGRDRLISGYRYEWKGVRRDFDAANVVHFAYVNPDDFYYGQPPLRACGRSVDIDTEAQSFQKVSLQNRGIPDGVFTLDEEVDEDGWRRAREQVREQYQTKDSFRAPWVVARATWNQMSLSPAELDYLKTRETTRQEICSTYDVPLPLVHVYDDATLANVREAKRIFWEDGMLPLADDLKQHLNQSLALEFGRPDQIRIVYDKTNIAALQVKYAEKIEQARSLWGMGVPLTEINRRLELGLETEDLPGATIGYLPASVLPAADFDFSGSTNKPGAAQTTEEPQGAAPAGVDPDTALNGAQVDAIVQLLRQVAMREMPRQSAVAVIVGAFPVTREQAEEMVGDIGRTFFIDPQETEQRQAQAVLEIRKSMDKYRQPTIAELARAAYGK